jgi:GT2 family glycosyltransferase
MGEIWPLNELGVSIIIPAHQPSEALRRCLAAVRAVDPPPGEVIVVVDGFNDRVAGLAAAFGVRIVQAERRAGPAAARNLGAQRARFGTLFFVDSDVLIGPDAVGQVTEAFQADPSLAALFGSYDDAPDAPGFVSQYKNLLHHYVHQTAREEASTFWSGCGAIRRNVFLSLGGFDPGYDEPAIEDVELGYRLRAAGHRVRLQKTLQVKHLKGWTLASLLRADFHGRALPWSQLILQRGFVDDLNVNIAGRLCVALVWLLAASLLVVWRWPVAMWVAAACAAWLLALNLSLYVFLARKRGAFFALAAVPLHWLYFGYSGLAFALALVRHLVMAPGRAEQGAE